MARLMSFSTCGFRPNRCYDESYGGDSDGFARDTRDQRRMFIELQRQAYMYRLHNHHSSPGGIGRSQPPFLDHVRPNPMMGSHPQFGVPSPLGVNMGGSRLGGTGVMGFRMGFGMGSGMRLGTRVSGGRRRSTGCSSRPPFLGDLRMGYGQSSLFGLGQSPQSHPIFTSRHRQNDQPSWPQARRAPSSTSFFGDDEDNESGYDSSTIYNHPRWRSVGIRQLGRSPYEARPRPNWMHNYNDRYEEYDDEDDEDYEEGGEDESDFEDYYPVRRRRPRY